MFQWWLSVMSCLIYHENYLEFTHLLPDSDILLMRLSYNLYNKNIIYKQNNKNIILLLIDAKSMYFFTCIRPANVYVEVILCEKIRIIAIYNIAAVMVGANDKLVGDNLVL